MMAADEVYTECHSVQEISANLNFFSMFDGGFNRAAVARVADASWSRRLGPGYWHI
jgi:hypothetical protein